MQDLRSKGAWNTSETTVILRTRVAQQRISGVSCRVTCRSTHLSRHVRREVRMEVRVGQAHPVKARRARREEVPSLLA